MTHMLLATKLDIPPPQPDTVPRPGLIARLNEGVDGKLTLISAPAGYGKTTLLSEWVGQIERPVAWLSLDRGDNDQTRFLHYLVVALQQIEPGIGEVAMVMLEEPSLPSPESALTALINDLTRLSQPVSILLDDYHVIEAQTVHRTVRFLLDHMPPTVHLVIATRADPPLQLARLRAGRQMAELREADLQFTQQEAADFLIRVSGLKLSSADIETLWNRTEGWIASLQMAAVSLQGRDNISTFIDDFSGSHEYVVDYLTDEVLSRLPDELEAFLLQTSILERLSGPLCDALTGQRDGQRTLRELKKANLFVVSLDTRRKWYRYHRLFADLLQRRLRASPAEHLAELHQRASEWHQEHGSLHDAIDHALKAESYDRAASLLEQIFGQAGDWPRINASILQGWLDALPAGILRARPQLRLTQARVLMVNGDLPKALEALDQLEAETRSGQFAGRDAKNLARRIHADRTSIAILEGRLSLAIEYAHQALAELPDQDVSGRMRQSAILGNALFRVGEVEQAQRWYSQAIAAARSLEIPIAVATLTTGLAQTQHALGQLCLAATSCERAMQLAIVEGQPTVAAGSIDMTWARICYEQNDLPAAESKLRGAIEQFRKSGPLHALAEAFAWLARTKQALGEADAADAAISQALDLIEGHAYGHLTTAIPAHQAHLWLARSRLEPAIRWAEAYRAQSPGEFSRLFEDLTLARVLLARGELTAAQALLKDLLSLAEAGSQRSCLIEIRLLQSLAYWQQRNEAQALQTLAQALSWAEPEGYVRTFIDQGEPLADLLAAAARKGIATAYATQLSAALGRAESLRQPPALPDPLSDRERQVLKLLHTDLTVPQIAEQLIIGVSTVRSHVKSIYSKLGVHSRYEAVSRAGELNLL